MLWLHDRQDHKLVQTLWKIICHNLIEFKVLIPYDLEISHSNFYPNLFTYAQGELYNYFHSFIVSNCKNLETTPISINNRMYKYTAVQPQNEMLNRNENDKLQPPETTWLNTRKITMSKKENTSNTFSMFPFIKKLNDIIFRL